MIAVYNKYGIDKFSFNTIRASYYGCGNNYLAPNYHINIQSATMIYKRRQEQKLLSPTKICVMRRQSH